MGGARRDLYCLYGEVWARVLAGGADQRQRGDAHRYVGIDLTQKPRAIDDKTDCTVVEQLGDQGGGGFLRDQPLGSEGPGKGQGLNGATAVDPTATSSPAKKDPPAEEQSSLYASRSAKVSAAATAGKSRWNDMENKKAQILAGAKHNGAKAPAAPESDAKPPPAPVPVPPEVAAADHGMRADGGVGGLTLAERVAMGSEAAAAAPAKTVPVPPEVLAADHGMRADGGVGGLTLAERVAFGAEAGAQTATSASELEVRHEDSLYQLRSMHVAKAAAAGKSRWGGMENKKCEELASSASSSLTAAAGRVNVGASIVGQ